MKNQKKNLGRLSIITSVVTFVFGLVGGQLIESSISSLFDTPTKAILTGLVIIGLMLATLFIVITSFAHRAGEREKTWLESVGTPAEMFFEHANVKKGVHYNKLISFIQQVSDNDEILIMTQHRALTPPEDVSKPHKQSRDKYSRLLLQKAKEKNVSYRRLICFEDCPEPIEINASCVRSWLVDHCREMLQIKKAKPDKISVKTSRTKIGADIFVITGKVGAVVLDVYEDRSGVPSTNSSLFFYNPPNSQIINQLRNWFMEIDGEEETLSVRSVA